jgi:hypothetical protein
VRLEKVVQSLIKGPILTSKASPCFTISIIVKMDSSSVKVRVLLDSEASTCFIDKDFADCHKLSLVTKKNLIPVEIIDGRPLVSGNVTHEIIPLYIVLKGHYSIIVFNIIKSSSNPVVLGLSWLDKYTELLTGRPEDWLFSQTFLQSKNPVIGKLLQV